MKTITSLFVSSILWMVSTATAAVSHDIVPLDTSFSSGRLVGYPGVLSRDYVRLVVGEELRNRIILMSQTAAKKKTPQSKRKDKARKGGLLRHRTLKKDDFKGLNDILETFEFEIPENIIQQDFLGATLTIELSGQCGDIQIKEIGLDYESEGDDLTYAIEVENLDVECTLDVKFDFGVYEIEDDLEIDIKLGDNDFAISVVLEGIPPDSSDFEGCEAEINIQSIDANGGFSANILNDLDYIIVELVENEKPVISQLLCEQISQFTSVVDGILITLTEAIEPYLGSPDDVDPLKLEKNLDEEGELVDFTNSDLGNIIQAFIDNLQGVVGPYQVNTLIELNLLDEDGVFKVDLAAESEEEDRTRSLQEECSLFRRRNLLSFLGDDFGRRLQFDSEEELFTVNGFDILTIEVAGLNTFDEVEFLEIIGMHTFRTKLTVSRLAVKATLVLDADIGEENIKETIEVTLPIEDIDITASYLVGLNAAAVEDIELATLLTSNALEPCLLSALQVAGLSELTVSVGELGSATIEGFLDSGVDELINTAIEAAIVHYQDLIVEEAIPNIAQQNVTVQANEFAECFIRTEASTAVCPEPEEDSQDSSNTITTGFFDFRRLVEKFFDY